MITFASIFTGGGLADVGAIATGLVPLWGIEIDPAIAAICQSNLGHPVHAQSVTSTYWKSLEAPDILWASPPCQSFSNAKKEKGETPFDALMANSICEAIEVFRPKIFILENVEGYRKSCSFAGIVDRLFELGYWANWSVVNAADFGVPQTRRRLILRAVRGEMPPALPTPVEWKSWYSAIADLIPSLPETELADWQVRLMPEITKTAILDTTNTIRAATVRTFDQPAMTVTASDGRSPSATKKIWLVNGQGNSMNTKVTVIRGDRPAYTVTASDHNRSHKVVARAAILKMTPRTFGRLQTLPDWYKLPQQQALACKIIGNGVPCDMAKALLADLKDAC